MDLEECGACGLPIDPVSGEHLDFDGFELDDLTDEEAEAIWEEFVALGDELRRGPGMVRRGEWRPIETVTAPAVAELLGAVAVLEQCSERCVLVAGHGGPCQL